MTTIPDYVRHDDPTVDRLMLAAWLITQGEEIAYGIARATLPDIDAATVDLTVNTTADYYRAIELATDDPAAYAYDEGLAHPHGITWTQWAEGEIEQLTADARSNVEQLVHGRPTLVRVS